MPDTAQILINVYDGTRQPLSPQVEWIARISDARSLSDRKTDTYAGLKGASKLFAVHFFDNFFDDYTVVVSPAGFDDYGWSPVRVHPAAGKGRHPGASERREADIDCYKDLLSHGLLEVIPNALSHGLTEPAVAFALRWMAGMRAGLPPFNPLYTVESD